MKLYKTDRDGYRVELDCTLEELCDRLERLGIGGFAERSELNALIDAAREMARELSMRAGGGER